MTRSIVLARMIEIVGMIEDLMVISSRENIARDWNFFGWRKAKVQELA